MTQGTAIAPIVKSVHVDCAVEDAFSVFTREISTWWPMRTHSINEESVRAVVLEEREGGELYEVVADGGRAEWGTVTVWEPPHRLVVSWHVNPQRPAPTEWEARFSPDGGGTRLDFEHRFWERLGDAAADARAQYDTGWDTVLEAYVERVASR
jgi:uncharacterized protein YndB with AHSA1/START domain